MHDPYTSSLSLHSLSSVSSPMTLDSLVLLSKLHTLPSPSTHSALCSGSTQLGFECFAATRSSTTMALDRISTTRLDLGCRHRAWSNSRNHPPQVLWISATRLPACYFCSVSFPGSLQTSLRSVQSLLKSLPSSSLRLRLVWKSRT